MNKKLSLLIIGIAVACIGYVLVTQVTNTSPVVQSEMTLGASVSRLERTMVPEVDSRYYLGTTSPSVVAWLQVIADAFYDTDASDGCAQWASNILTSTGSACGSGSGGSGSVATSSREISGQVPIFTSNSATPARIGGTNEFTFSTSSTQNILTIGTTTNLDTHIRSAGPIDLDAGGDGYYISLNASSGTTSNSGGGTIYGFAGNGSTTADGGGIELDAGGGGTTGGDGGTVLLASGQGGQVSGSGVGGVITFDAGRGGIPNGAGGDIWLRPGPAQGTGLKGHILLWDTWNAPARSVLDLSQIASSNKTFSFPNVTGTLGVGVATTSGTLAYWGSDSGLRAVATSSLAISGPFLVPTGLNVIGSNGSVTYTGLATTSQPSSSNVLTSNGGAGVYGTATTSVTCAGTVTCTTFNILGSTPITLTGTGGSGTGLSTSSPVSAGNVLVYSATGAGFAFGAATSSLSFTGPFVIANPIGVLTNGAITYTGLATTSAVTQSNLFYSSGGAGVANVGTTTRTFSGPFLSTVNPGALVGGSNSTITWTGLATTTNLTQSNILYSSGGAGVTGVATSTFPTISGPFIVPSTLGALVGGSGAITYTGLATTSAVTQGNVFYSSGGAGVSNVATGTITCTGSASCGTGSYVIGANLTITGSASGGTGLATTSPTANDQVLVYNSAGAGAAYSIATTSLSFTGPFAIANPIGVLKNGAVTYTGLATTSALTQGQLLYNTTGGNGVSSVATGTISAGSTAITVTAGRSAIGGALAIDCATATGAQAGCLSISSFGTFNNKVGTSSNETAGQLAYFTTTSGTPSLISGVATGTVSASGLLTATAGRSAIGGALAIALSAGANTVLVNNTSATAAPIALATSTFGTTLYGTGTGGQVLMWNNTTGAPAWSATSTSGGSGITALGSGYASTTGTTITFSTTTFAYGGLTFGQTIVPTAGALMFTPTVTGTLDTTKGGTGLTSLADGKLVFGAPSGNVVTALATTSGAGRFLQLDYATGRPSWVATSSLGINLSDTRGLLTVSKGGTGSTTLSGILVGNGTSAVNTLAIGSGLTFDGATLSSSAGTNYFTNSGASTYLSTGQNLGVGSSTPWAQLAIASSTYNCPIGICPLFAVSTSTDAWGSLITISATSTTLVSGQNPRNKVLDSGVRIGIGTNDLYGYGGNLDQLTVLGRINTGDMRLLECAGSGTIGGLSVADASNICGPWQFQLDTTGILIAVVDGGILALRICGDSGVIGQNCTGVSTPSSGRGIFAGGTLVNSIIFATSTPVLETTARINTPQNATSTNFYIGFVNIAVGLTAFEQEPTAGCYFVASTTLANWQGQCRTSIANTTTVDTGFASTTNMTGTGSYQLFRIEADSNGARFYMASSTAPLRLVANITTNIPTSALVSGIYFGSIGAGLVKQFDITGAKLWLKQPALNY